MQALSMQQPWAAAIVLGHKPIENRTWNTHYRGALLIHASKTLDRDWFAGADRFLPRAFDERYGVALSGFACGSDFPRGAIIGIARLTGVLTQEDITVTSTVTNQTEPAPNWTRWFEGPYGFVLEDVMPLDAIACRGMPGLFPVSAEIARAVQAQLGEEWERYAN